MTDDEQLVHHLRNYPFSDIGDGQFIVQAADTIERLTAEIQQKDDFLKRLRKRWYEQGAPQSALQEIDDLLTASDKQKHCKHPPERRHAITGECKDCGELVFRSRAPAVDSQK